MGYLSLLIPMMALSIPILAISLSFRQKGQKDRLRELELKKEIMQLEIESMNSKTRLLEQENKKLDRIIDS
jgi:uncharacterized protein YoxC